MVGSPPHKEAPVLGLFFFIQNKIMDLTTIYNSFPESQYRNKYEMASHYYNLNYRLITGRIAYTLDILPQVKQFIMEYQEVLALPNMFSNKVIGFLLRPIYTKAFRYYSETHIPYGAGINNKPYSSPWIIVESCLDSDYLRQFYPYVIATQGATISNFLQEFLFSTSPYIISGMDNDDAGNMAYRKLCYKYKGRVRKLDPPNGKKDFGEILDLLLSNDQLNFELESMMVKMSIQTLV